VLVSDLLVANLLFAVGVAERSDGAFDPSVGDAMVARGIARSCRSGALVAQLAPAGDAPSFRDVMLAPETRTVAQRRPLSLDLGGVAKGMAIDLAAQALGSYASFSIDAGGDVYLGGCKAGGGPWTAGIRHPYQPDTMIATVPVSNMAACTSATYERGEHLVDPRGARARQSSADDRLASATVLARTAMVADARATAAFVLGASDGYAFLQRECVEGLLVTRGGGVVTTQGFTGRLT
jgi:thiamine biosynthesis lipoprotein